MGEVYRARDVRLGREVAVKVLPAELATDRKRLARFEQEARAASALHHRNILTVYDLGQDGETSYLVTELLEGESLRHLLARGSLPPKRALAVAAEIAQGLAAAHEKGIVHRDLKPENVFVIRDKSVKILDFGLAKLTIPEGGSLLTGAATLGQETATGVVLGTVGYMSPEQVRGESVDWRADIFSFGCVLYEMLAGRRAFSQGSAVDTLSAILRDEPTALSSGSGGEISSEIEAAVSRCLAKDREDRWHSARDLAHRLEELAAQSEVNGPGARPAVGQAAAVSRRHRLLYLVAAVATLSLLTLAGGFGLYRWLGPRAKMQPPRWHRVSFRRGVAKAGRFAPDGKTILYGEHLGSSNRPQIFSTRIDSPESTALPLPEAELLAVSPDGRLALGLPKGPRSTLGRSPDETLALASLAGGGVREVQEGVAFADFTPDGKSLAVIHEVEDHSVLEFPIGHRLYKPGAGVDLTYMRVSPRGDRVAMVESRNVPGNYLSAAVVVVDLEGKRTVISDGWAEIDSLTWDPAGNEIWFTGRKAATSGGLMLFATSLSGKVRLIMSVPGLVRIQDIAKDGSVLVLHSQWPNTLVCRAPGSDHETDLSWLDFSFGADLSDDGHTVLLDEAGIAGGGAGAIFLRPTDGGDAVPLGNGSGLELSRDGKWVLALAAHSSGKYVLLPTGAGSEQAISCPGLDYIYAELFPSGRALLVRGRLQGGAPEVFRQAIGSKQVQILSKDDLRLGPISPDGRYAMVRGGATWRLLALDGSGKERPLAGLGPGDGPLRFDRDGRSLYVARGSVPVDVFRLDLTTGRRTKLYNLGPALTSGVYSVEAVALSADGQSYCYSYMRDVSDLYVVSGLH